MALGVDSKFNTSVEEAFQLKFRKLYGLIPTFVEVTGEKLVRREGELLGFHPD